MRWVSKRTWVFLALTFFFVCLVMYCEWRTGCGPQWLPKVHAQESTVASFDPCQLWQSMPLLDKIAGLGTFVGGAAFLISLGQDLAVRLTRNAKSS